MCMVGRVRAALAAATLLTMTGALGGAFGQGAPPGASPAAPRPSGGWSAKIETSPAAVVSTLPRATAIRLAGDGNRTEIRIDVTRPITANVFALDQPYRVIVDVPELDFQLGAPGQNPLGSKALGLVQDYRFGPFAGRSRIVIDLAAPVKVEGPTFSPAAAAHTGGKGAGAFILTLVRTDAGLFQSLRGSAEMPAAPAASADLRTGRHEDPRPAATTKTAQRGVVVIDPGHGGVDPGTVGAGGATEKTVTLAVAREIRSILQQQRKLDVYLTRDMDQFISLDQRVKLSQLYGADLFVSIHADSLAERDQVAAVRGATVYVLADRATDDKARRVAEKENAADILAGLAAVPASAEDQVRGILLDLVHRETSDYAAAFRNLLLQSMRGRVPLSKEPQRAAAFKVLRQDDVPAVLIELGYMSNTQDLARLAKPEGQRQVAAAIAEAINTFFAKREKPRLR